jgi:hypothetical protein
MKKILLFGLVSLFAVSVMAQTSKETVSKPNKRIVDVTVNQTLPMNTVVAQPVKSINKDGRAITIIPTGGTSGNAYGLYAGGKTALWADPALNTVSFIHRGAATPGSGFLTYDISKDGGATWTGNLGPVYSPDNVTHFNARYPQGLIYNPAANTNPDNAYLVSFAATLDGSNGGSWGGVGYGTYKLDGNSNLQGSLTSVNGIYHLIPTALSINSNGAVLGVDANIVNAVDYNDTILLYKGAFNATTQEVEFNVVKHHFYCTDGSLLTTLEKESPVEIKTAFHPTDPNIGYIAMVTHSDITLVPEEGYYPVVLKTTDGGATWSAPIPIPLKNFGDLISQDFLPDQDLIDFFDPNPVPARSDLWFRTAFDLDLVVDGDGNPHIAVVVGLGDNGLGLTSFSVWGGGAMAGMFDIYSPDGGTTWDAKLLMRLMNFRGAFADISEDPRPQAATNATGTKVFFSWLNTDTNTFGSGVTNVNPDIWVRGFDPATGNLTPIYNVTAGTSADGAAYMGTMSQWVLQSGSTYKIPLVYQDFPPATPTNPATFYYVHGFEITDADFTSSVENIKGNNLMVSQNYPNPFDGLTNIDVAMQHAGNLSVVIHNLMGQVVHRNDLGFVSAGNHKIQISTELTTGIYTYTVLAGDASVTRKMSVK